MIEVNALLVFFLVFFMASSIFRSYLTRINIKHLSAFGYKVPKVFKGEIDKETLSRMTSYTIESSRFGSIAGAFDDLVLLLILLSGILPTFVKLVLSFDLHFVFSGLIFFAFPALIGFITGIPFDLYSTFVIEKKYGFSTITLKLWIMDLLKGIIISVVLLGILLGAFLALVYYTPHTWWLWGWLLFASFQLFIMWVYPILLAPLFNKYEPIKDETLKDKILSLMEKTGLRAKGVFQVDAGKRSKHSNAYFTGIGKTKRIVLFDTLLSSHTHDEILSILAHEIGHWKKKHILKQLVLTEVLSFVGIYIAYRLVDWQLMYTTFGFDEKIVYVGLFLLGALFKPVSFCFTPIGSAISRKYEREADDYSNSIIGTTKAMCSALKRLAKDNLSNLYPHPFYTWFYYSHPPLTERIERLQQIDAGRKSVKK